jgi:hypothetical protein
MSQLRAQPVNAVYRFVTMVYHYNYPILGTVHRPIFYIKYDVSETGG